MTNLFEQLANGECIKVENILKSDVKDINYDLFSNKYYEDSVNIFNDREVEFEANVYTDNNRIILKESTIKAKRYKLSFQIDTHNLCEDDYIEGKISIISDIGDIDININYHIIYEEDTKIIKTFNTVFDYYQFYIDNKQKAKLYFTNKNLFNAPFMDDTFTYTIYDCLLKSVNLDIAFIEFLSAFDINIKDEEIENNENVKKIYNNEIISESDKNSDKDKSDVSDIVEDKKNPIARLVELIKDKELTDNLAVYCIRNNLKNEVAFNIYLSAVINGTILNGLFDKFLLSIPKNFNIKMPLYVYKLFFEDKSYSFEQKLNLYENIINVFNENDQVYQIYKNEIRDYAISQIYQIKISESLAKIYNNILNESIINKNNSKNILYLLRSYKIIVKNSSIKKIIIKYKEVLNETKYSVINHIAYVPIFFDSYIMFYEDSFGNRYLKVDSIIKQLFDKPELESYCLKNFPDEGIVDISKVLNYLTQNQIKNEIECFDAKLYLEKLKINVVVKKQLVLLIIDYFYSKSINGTNIKSSDINFLKKLKYDILDIAYIHKIAVILINNNEYEFVFDLLLKYDNKILNVDEIENLCIKLLSNNLISDKKVFNNEVLFLLRNDIRNVDLVSYLNDNIEQGINEYVFVLRLSSELSLDCFNLSKKTLIRMLSINHNDDLDYVFSLYDYSRDDTDLILSAYLTKKVIDYFLDNVDLDENKFSLLSRYVIKNMTRIEQVPLIYQFAFSKYISNLEIIDNNDIRRVLIHIVDFLLANKYCFNYFKKLNKFIKMPMNIMNKEYIEYHSTDSIIPKVVFNIGNNQKEIDCDMTRVYKNIFIKKITVFKYEVINYKIYAQNNPEAGILDSGSLTHDDNYDIEYNNSKIKNTYNSINNAIIYLNDNKLENLKITAIELIRRQEVSKQLFNI